MQTIMQDQQILGILEGARLRSLAAGLPRVAVALTREGPADVTNCSPGAQFKRGERFQAQVLLALDLSRQNARTSATLPPNLGRGLLGIELIFFNRSGGDGEHLRHESPVCRALFRTSPARQTRIVGEGRDEPECYHLAS